MSKALESKIVKVQHLSFIKKLKHPFMIPVILVVTGLVIRGMSRL